MPWLTRLKMGDTITINGAPITLDRPAAVRVHAAAEITVHRPDGTLALKKVIGPEAATEESTK